MSGLISVIIPAYNAEKFIKYCIDSVLEQTYKNFEIIVINDGSTDSTELIVKKYAEKFSNIKLISKKNEGVSKARNVGLDNAKGEFIFFIDSDDTIDSRAFQLLIKYMDDATDMVHIDCKIIKSYDDIVDDENVLKHSILSSKDMLYNIYEVHKIVAVSVWGYLYRKELFSDIRFPEDKIRGEDEAVITNIFAKCRQGVFLNKKYYYYYQNPHSIMHKKDIRIVLNQIEVLKNRVYFFESIDMYDLIEKAFNDYLRFTCDGICKLIKWNMEFRTARKVIKDNREFYNTYCNKFNIDIKYKLAMKSILLCILVKLTGKKFNHY